MLIHTLSVLLNIYNTKRHYFKAKILQKTSNFFPNFLGLPSKVINIFIPGMTKENFGVGGKMIGVYKLLINTI